MTSPRAAVLLALLSLCAAFAAHAAEKKSSGKPAASRKSTADKRLQWEEKSDPKGFTLKVPREFTEKRDEWTTAYRVVLAPDSAQLNTVVSVEMLDELTPITSLEKAVAFVLSKRPAGVKTTIAEQQELPKGYLVVIGPDYDIFTLHVIRNGKEVQVRAQCSGPAARLKELKEMCLSVKPTK